MVKLSLTDKAKLSFMYGLGIRNLTLGRLCILSIVSIFYLVLVALAGYYALLQSSTPMETIAICFFMGLGAGTGILQFYKEVRKWGP